MKTLKDFSDKETYNRLIMGPKFNALEKERFISEKDLQQAAREWFNWLEESSDITKVFEQETRSSEVCYAAAVDPDQLKDHDLEVARRICRDRLAIAGWIKMFFNLEDEDEGVQEKETE